MALHIFFNYQFFNRTILQPPIIQLGCFSTFDQTREITSSEADRLAANTASKSRSRCDGELSKFSLVVPAVVKSAEESANQPSVVSSLAIYNGCIDQCSALKPAAVKPSVLDSDVQLRISVRHVDQFCSNAVVAKAVEEAPESLLLESHVPVSPLYCDNQALVAGSSGLPWCINKVPVQTSFVLTGSTGRFRSTDLCVMGPARSH
uniref:Uncharacterized protein n=1 Tax=Ditylenchus dipsaci TaxID=166011 RepID=A0A915CYP8_9BILA